MADKQFDNVKLTVSFEEAAQRENIQSGENIATSFGKISKMYNDLHDSAYTGDAESAKKLNTNRTIDGVSFDGSANINHYAICDTEAVDANKLATSTSGTFTLDKGSSIYVKFNTTNNCLDTTLDVDGSGPKPIHCNGSAIPSGYIKAGGVYQFVFDGIHWVINSGINTNTNTTYSVMTGATAEAPGKSGLVPVPNAGQQNYFLKGDGTWAIPANENSMGYKSGAGIEIANNTIYNTGVLYVTEGDVNGTINVTHNTDNTTSKTSVPIKGLKSAAYTDSSSYASSEHNHGLNSTNFTGSVNDTTTTWKSMNIENSGHVLKSLSGSATTPDFFVSNNAAGIAFGGSDTKGIISTGYDSPEIKFAGGNGTEPKWYLGITGTSGSTYNLNSFSTTSHNHDSTYLKLSGGTVKSSSLAPLTIERSTNNTSAISFKNSTGLLGSIGSSAVNGNLQRINTDGTTTYDILDTGNFKNLIKASDLPTHTHNYAASETAGGPAKSVKSSTGTTNVARNVWFSTDAGDGNLATDNDFKYNPSTNILTVGSITGSAAKLTTARSITINNDLAGTAKFDGSGDITISTSFYNVTCTSSETANYPWHRIAYIPEITSTHADRDAIIAIRAAYSGGSFGLLKISLRTNNTGSVSTAKATWLVRSGFSANAVQIGLYNVFGKTYADVFLKCGTYARTTIYQILGNRSITLVKSVEAAGTTTTDAKTSTEAYTSISAAATALHNQAYTNTIVAVDGSGYIPLTGTTITNPNTSSFSLTNGVSGDIVFTNTDATAGSAKGIGGIMGNDDCWTVRGYYATADQGHLEIAVGDNGNEGIYVRQYTSGGYKLPITNKAGSASGLTYRELTLMAPSTGASVFPASITASGEIIGKSANAFRAAFGDYGFIIRTDAQAAYFLLTAKGSATGAFTSARPFYISFADATVTMNTINITSDGVLRPSTTGSGSLGNSSYKWATGYINTINSTATRIYNNPTVTNTQTSQLIVGSTSGAYNSSSSGTDVAIELWRGKNTSWQIVNSGGTLSFKNNYVNEAITNSYGTQIMSLAYNTGDVTIKGVVTASSFKGSGASLTALNATNITSGTLAVARLATSGATAGSYGPSAAASPAHGGTFSVPYITIDKYGRVTAASTKTITLPKDNDTNTDIKVNVTLATTTKAYLLGTSTTPTSTAQAVTALADTGVYLDTTAGKLTATSFAGSLSGNASSATKIYGTVTNPTTETAYGIPFHTNISSENKSLLNNDGLRYFALQGTASAAGYGGLILGNNTSTGTAGNKYGRIRIYGQKSGYVDIRNTGTGTSAVDITLPTSSGTLALTNHTHIWRDKWFQGNRFAFIPAAAITIEYTRNGTTWTDYGATDAQKIALFTTTVHLNIGKSDADNLPTPDSKLRVTIDCSKTGGLYTYLDQCVICVSTNGSNGSTVEIQTAAWQSDDSAALSYKKQASASLSGWSGHNNISLGFTCSHSKSTSFIRCIRFIFSHTSYSTSTNYFGLDIMRIHAYGGEGWNLIGGTYAQYGVPYTVGADKKTSFIGAIQSNEIVAQSSTYPALKTVTPSAGGKAGLGFYNGTTPALLGSIAMNATNGNLYRYTSNSSTSYKIFDTGTTIPVANGGTGATDEFKASYNLFNKMTEETDALTDSTLFGFKYQTPTETKGSLYSRKASTVWTYIHSKLGSITREIVTSSGNGFRITQNGYGFFIRNDGSNVYFMLTNKDNAGGQWNDFRPLIINNATGVCNINGNAGSATKIHSAYRTTGDDTLAIPFHAGVGTSENKSLNHSTGLRYRHGNGTTSANGYADLFLGNSTASGTANNMRGRILMYGTSSGYTLIQTGYNSTSSITLTLPSSGGTLALNTNMTAATASAAGKAGLVPAPAAGKQTSFLRGDGTWAVPTDANVKQGLSETANFRPIVLGTTNSTDVSTLAESITSQLYVTTNMYAQPSTGTIYATKFSGALSGNASSASKVSITNATIQTGSTKMAHISFATLISYLVTTKKLINASSQYTIIHVDWSYADNDILQLTCNGTKYEVQLAGCVMECFGNPGNGTTGTFRFKLHTAPAQSFTATDGYAKAPVSAVFEYFCQGANYSPTWRLHSYVGHTHSYLPLSGGTMTGSITLPGNLYYASADKFGLNLQNSDIVGVNSIYFQDLCDGAEEGIQWYRGTNADSVPLYDSLWCKNGVLYFTPNRVKTSSSTTTGSTILHTGNAFTTTVPKQAGTAAVGTATTVSRSDHVHPIPTVAAGGTGATTAAAARANLGTMGAKLEGNYYGMMLPDGTTEKWIRTTTSGIIPVSANGDEGSHSALGTSSWTFTSAYIKTVYGSLSGNATTATTASKVSITAGTDDKDRYVFFNHATVDGQLVYDTDFKYNPSTNILTVPNVKLISGTRSAQLSGKSLKFTVDSGSNWAIGLDWYKSDNSAILCSMGAYGLTDSTNKTGKLQYVYIGSTYSDTWWQFKPTGTTSNKTLTLSHTEYGKQLIINRAATTAGVISAIDYHVNNTRVGIMGFQYNTDSAINGTFHLRSAAGTDVFKISPTGAVSCIDNITVTKASKAEPSVAVNNGTYNTRLLIGSSGTNRGLYDDTLGNWLVYIDADKKVTLNGNATTATTWATSRNINGMSVNGSANRVNYGSCSTAAATAAKTVACTGFALITGSEITVKFTVTNTAASPTLNVNSTGAKAIYYRGSAITAGYLAANHTYTFRYNGTQYELVGDINTNTVYTHPTSAGNKHIPSGGAANQFLKYSSAGTAAWASLGKTIFSGSSTTSGNTSTVTLTEAAENFDILVVCGPAATFIVSTSTRYQQHAYGLTPSPNASNNMVTVGSALFDISATSLKVTTSLYTVGATGASTHAISTAAGISINKVIGIKLV